jgi:hypothetical protein
LLWNKDEGDGWNKSANERDMKSGVSTDFTFVHAFCRI